jgi:superkiller protein 3
MAAYNPDHHNPEGNGAVPDHDNSMVSAQSYIDQGNKAIDDQEYDIAVEAFTQAVQLAPNDAHAHYNLALALQYQGETETAAASYLQAIQHNPQLIEAYINLGNLYSELGQHENALETFQQATEIRSDDADLYVNVGDAYRSLGLTDDAIQAYRQALIIDPSNTMAADMVAVGRERIAQEWKRILDAERHIDSAPGDITRYPTAVAAYVAARRYQDALSVCNQMLALEPDNPRCYAALAEVYEALDDAPQAIESWSKVVALEPDNAEAWEHLGTWHTAQEHTADAIKAYARAVELDPSNIGSRFSLAEVYTDAGRYVDAIPIYQSIIDEAASPLSALEMSEETLADAYAGLAETYNAAGQYEEAARAARKLLEQSSDDPMGLYQLATALDELGQRDEAINAYERAMQADPLNADIMNDLADTYLAAERFNDAIAIANSAVAIDPTLRTAWETLAEALRVAGRLDEADQAEQRARELED